MNPLPKDLGRDLSLLLTASAGRGTPRFCYSPWSREGHHSLVVSDPCALFLEEKHQSEEAPSPFLTSRGWRARNGPVSPLPSEDWCFRVHLFEFCSFLGRFWALIKCISYTSSQASRVSQLEQLSAMSFVGITALRGVWGRRWMVGMVDVALSKGKRDIRRVG